MLIPGISLSIPYSTEFVGCTQIVDAYGHILAHRRAEEGPGIVTAEVSIGQVEPIVPIEDKFWLPNLPIFVWLYWHQQNFCGKSYYRRKGKLLGLENAMNHIKKYKIRCKNNRLVNI
jgi:hypothetical protein